MNLAVIWSCLLMGLIPMGKYPSVEKAIGLAEQRLWEIDREMEAFVEEREKVVREIEGLRLALNRVPLVGDGHTRSSE